MRALERPAGIKLSGLSLDSVDEGCDEDEGEGSDDEEDPKLRKGWLGDLTGQEEGVSLGESNRGGNGADSESECRTGQLA